MKRFILFSFAFVLGSNLWAQTESPPQGNRKALLPDISAIGSFAGGWFQQDPVGDQGENPSRTGFNLQGVELGLQSVIDPYVRGDLFILFHEDTLEVEEARITTLALPWNLQLRAGKLMARFGRENTQHLEQLSFVDFSRTSRYFFGVDGFHELGAEASLLLPTHWFSEVSFDFLQGENAGNFDSPNKASFAYVGHWTNSFDLTDTLTLQNGLSGAFGTNATGPGHTTQIYGTDLYLRWRPGPGGPSPNRGLKWQTEYFLRNREAAATTDVEGGFYSQLVGQFARRWEMGVRYDFVGLPQTAFRQRAATPMLTFLATEFFKIRAEYSLSKADGAPYRSEAFLQLQFNMGPHGAHTF